MKFILLQSFTDPELTAGEVVSLVLEALRNNDNPTPNRGVEILFGYSAPGSQIKEEDGLTPENMPITYVIQSTMFYSSMKVLLLKRVNTVLTGRRRSLLL